MSKVHSGDHPGLVPEYISEIWCIGVLVMTASIYNIVMAVFTALRIDNVAETGQVMSMEGSQDDTKNVLFLGIINIANQPSKWVGETTVAIVS